MGCLQVGNCAETRGIIGSARFCLSVDLQFRDDVLGLERVFLQAQSIGVRVQRNGSISGAAGHFCCFVNADDACIQDF